jgi:uncharacterized protein (TIGR02246 family)
MGTVEDEVVAAEKAYWQALKDMDVDKMVELTDEPCFVTGAQGVGRIDKHGLAEMMKHVSYQLRKFDVDGFQVRLVGPDVAIVAYTVHEELTVDGQPVTLDAADASTWVKRDGKWVCALHTEALRGDPFGRDRGQPSA